MDRDFTGPISKKILSEAFSEWPTIRPEHIGKHYAVRRDLCSKSIANSSSFRTFRKNPGPIVLAILAAALGIGANTAIFSVIRGVLLRPLPYLEPDCLVVIRDSNPAVGTFHENSSSANFLDWRDQNQIFASMAAYADWVPAALIDGEPEQLMAEHISANFFATLAVRPAIGRDFTQQEDQLGRNNVVILSDGFWARRFGRDRAVLGQKILLDNAPYTIVGVMPARFESPNIGQRRRPVELWRPLAEWTHENRSSRYMRVIARLKPGVTLDVARARMIDLSRRLGRIYPEDAGWETETHRLDDEPAGASSEFQITHPLTRPLTPPRLFSPAENLHTQDSP